MKRSDPPGAFSPRGGGLLCDRVKLTHLVVVGGVVFGGCAYQLHQPTVVKGSMKARTGLTYHPGESDRPYEGTPYYMDPPLPEPPPRGGYYDERLPVAGRAWRPGRDVLDEVRLRLARIDAAAVRLRTQGPPAERQNVV